MPVPRINDTCRQAKQFSKLHLVEIEPSGDHVKSTILIVNRNLAFVFRFGRILEAAGHLVLPARGVRDARVLLRDSQHPIDLVLIHHAAHGANCLIEELRQAQGRISVVDLCVDGRQEPDSQEDLTDPRTLPFLMPRLPSAVGPPECLGIVEGLLADTLMQVSKLYIEKT